MIAPGTAFFRRITEIASGLVRDFSFLCHRHGPPSHPLCAASDRARQICPVLEVTLTYVVLSPSMSLPFLIVSPGLTATAPRRSIKCWSRYSFSVMLLPWYICRTIADGEHRLLARRLQYIWGCQTKDVNDCVGCRVLLLYVSSII